MFDSAVKVDGNVSLHKKFGKTTLKPRMVSIQRGGDDVAMGATKNNISHEIIIQPTHVQKELLTTPTKKTKAEEFFFIGKIRMPIPLSDHKPEDIKPTFRTPPRYIE